MKTIWEYKIDIVDVQEIKMPRGAKLIHVGLDPNDDPCVWAIVDSNNEEIPVTIAISGTGHQIPKRNYFKYIGTFPYGWSDKTYIWHVFADDQAVNKEKND